MRKNTVTYAFWTAVLLAVVYFLNRNTVPYLSGGYDVATFGTRYFARFTPTLLLHVILGSIAAVIGPFQFIPAIRDRYPAFHRTSGKVYLCAVAIAGIVSFDLSVNLILRSPERLGEWLQGYGVAPITNYQFHAYGTGLVFLSVAWLSTLFIAFAAIRKGKVTLHQEWMRRNYIVTLGFLFYRVGLIILFKKLHLGYYDVIDMMAWGCWSVPLLINEVVQGVNRLRSAEARGPALSTGTTG